MPRKAKRKSSFILHLQMLHAKNVAARVMIVGRRGWKVRLRNNNRRENETRVTSVLILLLGLLLLLELFICEIISMCI